MIKQPNCKDNFKTIVLANEKFKRISQSNEQFLPFLESIGFTKVGEENATQYKFLEEEGKGDRRVLAHILTLL